MTDLLRALSRDEAYADSRSSHNNGSMKKKTLGEHFELLAASKAVPDLIPVRTAIATVSNKEGLPELGAELAKYGIEVISTEGTAKCLQQLQGKGLKLTNLTSFTGYPENLNGRRRHG